MKDVAVVAYCRTGIARATRGALNQTHGIPMTAHVLRLAVKRAGIDPAEVEDVVVGCGLPEGATGHNIARNAALEAGFGDAVPGMTVNRYCGSGLSAASIVANRIAAGEATIAIAAGVESISLVQFNLDMNDFFYAPLQQRMPAVWWTMNQTADFVAQKYAISREAQDAYVVRSQERVAAAAAAGKFAEEIVPFTTTMQITDKETKASHEQEVTLDRDEGPRPDTTLAGLAALKPVYPGGTTTAGNASQLSDGAAALVMMDADQAVRRGLPILGLFRGMQLAAVAARQVFWPASVSKTCLVRFDNNKYSVAAGAVGRPVEVHAYADRIIIRQDGRIVAEHPRSFGRGDTFYDPWHYVPVLARKPGALRNGAPFKDWVLPAAIERVRRKLAGADDGNRQMVDILTAVLTDGLPAVEAACAEAIAHGVHSANVVLNILARQRDPAPPATILTPAALTLRVEHGLQFAG